MNPSDMLRRAKEEWEKSPHGTWPKAEAIYWVVDEEAYNRKARLVRLLEKAGGDFDRAIALAEAEANE